MQVIAVPVRCPHAPTACKMASLIRVVKSEHDSIGGTVIGHVSGMPIGLGEPCFDKLEVNPIGFCPSGWVSADFEHRRLAFFSLYWN